MTDQEATRAAQDVLSGSRDETAVRRSFAVSIRHAGIADGADDPDDPDDLAVDIRPSLWEVDDFLTHIVTCPGPAGLDLAMIADGASLHEWARNLCRSVSPRIASNARRAGVRRAVLGDTAGRAVAPPSCRACDNRPLRG